VRRRYVITYDVSDDRRRDRIFTVLQGYADHVQFSVFVAALTAEELIGLRIKLRRYLSEAEDQILIVDVGREETTAEDPFEILGKPYRPPTRTTIV
jgi:CRISPR-associated protein Cas2